MLEKKTLQKTVLKIPEFLKNISLTYSKIRKHFPKHRKSNFCLFFSGTRIIYERAFLMNMRHSPLSQTPPKNIPAGLMKGMPHVPVGNNHIGHSPNNGHMDNVLEETAEQFQMDM